MNKANGIYHLNVFLGVRMAAVFVLLIFLGSCDYDRRKTGWEFGDDMSSSEAYESYTANPVFKDGKTMQPPVAGTIPRGTSPYPYEKNDEDRAKAAGALENPLDNSHEDISRGKRYYGVFCLSCHGEKGDGQGPLFVNKKYPFPPASLLSDKMMGNPEGEIFHVITVGHGIMPEHGSMISREDRWRIAMYIKDQLQKN